MIQESDAEQCYWSTVILELDWARDESSETGIRVQQQCSSKVSPKSEADS